VVQRHAAHQLNVEVPHAERALAGLADDRERLGQHLVERRAAGDARLELAGLRAEPGVVGRVEVVKPAYPDPTQFDRKSRYYDPGATRDAPRWLTVDVKFAGKTRVVGLAELRAHKELRNMQVLQRGSRLSITPVTAEEWECILRLMK